MRAFNSEQFDGIYRMPNGSVFVPENVPLLRSIDTMNWEEQFPTRSQMTFGGPPKSTLRS